MLIASCRRKKASDPAEMIWITALALVIKATITNHLI
jgi:hypothetical protein